MSDFLNNNKIILSFKYLIEVNVCLFISPRTVKNCTLNKFLGFLHSLRVSCAPHHPNRKNLMETIGLILLVIGFLIALVYGIQLLIVAFRESIWWGLGSIFIPLVSLIFVIMYWPQAKSPFRRGLLAIPFYLVGFALSPSAAMR